MLWIYRKMKFFNKSFLCLLCSVLFFSKTFAEDFQRFSVIPFLAYSEETEIQYGILGLIFFKPFSESQNISSVDLLLQGTTKNQYMLRTKPDFFFLKDKIHLPMEFSISRWQTFLFERGANGDFESYDDFLQTSFCFQIPLEMNFFIPETIPFRYGILTKGEIRKNNLNENSVAKELHDGLILGGGYKFLFDNRDNRNWPLFGYYFAFEEIFYGGDFKFHTESLDIRFYLPIIFNTTLTLAGLFEQSLGSAPLGYLAGADGISRFRGVDSHVWNDTRALIYQIEFRKKLFWRLAGVIFTEFLQTGNKFSNLFENEFHYSVGFGGRLALNKKEALYARGDISLIDGKHLGLTINIREAF